MFCMFRKKIGLVKNKFLTNSVIVASSLQIVEFVLY